MEMENKDQNQQSSEAIGSFLWEIVRMLVIALVIIVPLRLFIAEPFIVDGQSMEPNFHNNDYLIVDKISYRLTDVDRGDVVVFHYPKDTSQYFIKRIIGLPGEQVKIGSGRVTIINSAHPDGMLLDESFLPNQAVTFTPGGEKTTQLGENQYFVMGDNRAHSSDSREWGILPTSDIVGKAWLRLYPFPDAQFIHHPDLAF